MSSVDGVRNSQDNVNIDGNKHVKQKETPGWRKTAFVASKAFGKILLVGLAMGALGLGIYGMIAGSVPVLTGLVAALVTGSILGFPPLAVIIAGIGALVLLGIAGVFIYRAVRNAREKARLEQEAVKNEDETDEPRVKELENNQRVDSRDEVEIVAQDDNNDGELLIDNNSDNTAARNVLASHFGNNGDK